MQATLVKDPKERFQSIQAFATAFEQACEQGHFHPFTAPSRSLLPTIAATVPQQPITMSLPLSEAWQSKQGFPKRTKPFIFVGSFLVVIAVIVSLILGRTLVRGNPTTGSNPPGITLTTAQSQATSLLTPFVNPGYPPVDGISCDTLEQTTEHYHVHVSIYINGQQVQIAAQVGIPTDGTCLYWLHTHDTSGVIHIEAPANHAFMLGNFFDIWGKKFSSLQYPPELNQPGGSGWQAWVNGQPYHGDFHSIVLQPHLLITLAYNTPGVQPDTIYNWGSL